ncbi:hypothetical protein ANN_11819 [Periplaneta americana]|uniref:Uncharacterized protein n=1 Tax=Periplaneta americana TaxID=6978 RepID=A0ABQ8T635_PERAM|nr:hypothetical protein ANN_11819 [Periplaneta americana]
MPSTWAGIETATSSTEGQRYTDYATEADGKFYNVVIFYNDEVRSEDSPKDYPAFAFWLGETSEKPNQVSGKHVTFDMNNLLLECHKTVNLCVSDVRHFNKSPKEEIKILRRMSINPGTSTIAGFVASMENKDKNTKKHSTPEVKIRRSRTASVLYKYSTPHSELNPGYCMEDDDDDDDDDDDVCELMMAK